MTLLAFLVCVFVYALCIDLVVLRRWTERPVLYVFPLVGAIAFALLWRGVLRKDSRWLFAASAAIFSAAFGTLAVSFLPYIVPWSITIVEAASPAASLWFMFWGVGMVLFPLNLIYSLSVYFIFRRKMVSDDSSCV